MPARIFLFLIALFSALPAAHGATGIVIRLVTGDEAVSGPVSTTLTNAEGVVYTATLLDDGESPDVNPGDLQYSGSTMLEGDKFQVSLSLGDDTEDVGEVSWPSDVSARDLVITRYNGIVTLETGTGSNGGAAGEPVVGGEPATAGGTPPPDVQPGTVGTDAIGTEGNVRGPAVTFSRSSSSAQDDDDSTLYVIGGILLLVLAIVAYFWFKPQETQAPQVRFAGSSTAHRLPQPGLLGEGSPSLSDGASVWVIQAADTDDFLAVLMGAIANHNRLLVVAPGSAELPTVAGGPVFRMKNPRPSHVADTINALVGNPGNPMAILIKATGVDDGTINEYCERLPNDVGAAIVVNGDYSGPEPVVTVSRHSDGWRLTTATSTVRLTMNPWGMSAQLTETKDA